MFPDPGREQMVGIPPPPHPPGHEEQGRKEKSHEETVLKWTTTLLQKDAPMRQRSRVKYTVRSGLAPEQPCRTQGQSNLMMWPLKVPSRFNSWTWTHAGEGLQQEGTISRFIMFIFVATR